MLRIYRKIRIGRFMITRLFRKRQEDTCSNICCTKIKDFTVITNGKAIFEDVNLHVHCGQLTSLIGPNGAGKSTLLKAIVGEVEHTGEIVHVDEKGNKASSLVIGYVPQYFLFDLTSPMTVLDLFQASLSKSPICFFPDKNIRSEVEKALDLVRGRNLIDCKLGNLSGGELQRVLLSLALKPKPNLLLLDEPVSGVDLIGLELFFEILEDLKRSEDMAIILISHDLNMVFKYADQVVLMNKKVITSGTVEEVFNDRRAKKIFSILNKTNAFEWQIHTTKSKPHQESCGCAACKEQDQWN